MNVHFLLAMSLCFYVFYIFTIAIMMFKRRKKAIEEKEIHHSFFKTYTGAELPDDLIIVARHFDNQFQVPMLFMITGSLLLTFVHLPAWVAILAWVFVLSRVVHSRIHLGSNVALSRAKAYVVGWLVLFILWIKIVITFV